jgi:hypothetical protein
MESRDVLMAPAVTEVLPMIEPEIVRQVRPEPGLQLLRGPDLRVVKPGRRRATFQGDGTTRFSGSWDQVRRSHDRG